MRDSYQVGDSDKYIANTLFISGFACCSVVGGVVLEILKKGNFTFLNLWTTMFTVSLLVVGFALMMTGWFVLGEMEERNARNERN